MTLTEQKKKIRKSQENLDIDYAACYLNGPFTSKD